MNHLTLFRKMMEQASVDGKGLGTSDNLLSLRATNVAKADFTEQSQSYTETILYWSFAVEYEVIHAKNEGKLVFTPDNIVAKTKPQRGGWEETERTTRVTVRASLGAEKPSSSGRIIPTGNDRPQLLVEAGDSENRRRDDRRSSTFY
jgi:hypothetical protein